MVRFINLSCFIEPSVNPTCLTYPIYVFKNLFLASMLGQIVRLHWFQFWWVQVLLVHSWFLLLLWFMEERFMLLSGYRKQVWGENHFASELLLLNLLGRWLLVWIHLFIAVTKAVSFCLSRLLQFCYHLVVPISMFCF